MNQLILDLTAAHYDLGSAVLLAQSGVYSSPGAESSPLASLIQFVFGIGSYIFSSYCLQRIFDKLSVKDSWLAWVPIANAVKIFQVGDKNPWLLLLILIPFIGAIAVLVLSIMAMMNIAKKLGKESWLAIAIIVPILGLWAMYSLAFP